MRGADAEDPGFQGAENEENERRKLKLQRQLEKLRAENEEKERRKLKLQRQIKRVKNAGNLAEALDKDPDLFTDNAAVALEHAIVLFHRRQRGEVGATSNFDLGFVNLKSGHRINRSRVDVGASESRRSLLRVPAPPSAPPAALSSTFQSGATL
jgi:hypothetical protein